MGVFFDITRIHIPTINTCRESKKMQFLIMLKNIPLNKQSLFARFGLHALSLHFQANRLEIKVHFCCKTIFSIFFPGASHRLRASLGTDRGGDGSFVSTVAHPRLRPLGPQVLHTIFHASIHAAGTEGLQVSDDGFDESVVSSRPHQSDRVGRRHRDDGVRADAKQRQRVLREQTRDSRGEI